MPPRLVRALVFRILPPLLVAGGAVLFLVAVGADLIGLGHGGIGLKQALIALAGAGAAGAGWALRTAPVERRVDRALGWLWGEKPLSMRQLSVVAVAGGATGGLAEIVVQLFQVHALGKFQYVSDHVLWMAPLSFVALFLVILLPAAIAGRWVPALRSESALVPVLAFVGSGAVLLNFHPELALWAIVVLALGLSAAVTRWFRGRGGGARRALARAGLALTVVLPLLSLGMGATRDVLAGGAEPGAERGADGDTSVLLIILDTVRARSLGLYGYERATTPELTDRAAGGVTFDRAYATAPWTLPTHASVFTGRVPHELSADHVTPLDGEHPTVAEVFRDAGYRTAGFVANEFYAGPHTGLARGFQHYDADIVSARELLGSTMLGKVLMFPESMGRPSHDFVDRKSGGTVTREFLSWVSSRGDRPFFAFLNYFDAHDPYEPPAPYDTLFRDDEPPDRPLDLSNHPWLSEGEIEERVRDYDASIAYLDTEIERLLDALRERGVLSSTAVIITSDHGEEFLEKGALYHGHTLYAAALHVPLVILGPDVPPGVRVAEPVSLRDLAATALDLAGLDRSDRLEGRSLSRFWHSGDRPGDGAGDRPEAETRSPRTAGDSGYVLAETSGAEVAGPGMPIHYGNMVAAVGPRFHYVQWGNGHEELFDLARDPWEQENLAEAGRADSVMARLREWVAPAVEIYRPRTNPFWQPSSASSEDDRIPR